MATGKVFERHKQAWTTDEVQKLHMLAKKGQGPTYGAHWTCSRWSASTTVCRPSVMRP